MEERVVTEETSNPIDIYMRRAMKSMFLNQLDEAANKNSANIPKKYGMIIYGSSVMHCLSYETQPQYQFPYGGLKSSDIDIGGVVEGMPDRNTTTKEEFRKYLAPLLKEATIRSGFELWLPEISFSGSAKGTIKKKVRSEELEQTSKLDFVGEYFVARKFTRKELVDYFKDSDEYAQIEPYIISHFDTNGLDTKTVCMAISADDEPSLTIMAPHHIFPRSQIDYMRIDSPRYFKELPIIGMARPHDVMAGKISRCMGALFKPTDLLDIYNLITGHELYHKDRKAIYGLEGNCDDRGDFELVRLLSVTYLLCSYTHFDHTNPDLLKNFKNTPENKEKLVAAIKAQIVEYKQDELIANLDNVYAAINTYIGKLFEKKEVCAYYEKRPEHEIDDSGPLNLTQGERNYVRLFQGKEPQRVDNLEKERSFWQKLLFRPRQFELKHVADGEAGQHRIDSKRMNSTAPLCMNTFYNRPYNEGNMLEDWLSRNTKLNEKLHLLKFGRQSTGPGGDF